MTLNEIRHKNSRNDVAGHDSLLFTHSCKVLPTFVCAFSANSLQQCQWVWLKYGINLTNNLNIVPARVNETLQDVIVCRVQGRRTHTSTQCLIKHLEVFYYSGRHDGTCTYSAFYCVLLHYHLITDLMYEVLHVTIYNFKMISV